MKNNPTSSIVPVLDAPNYKSSHKKDFLVKLNGIKMTGACFHEIFTEKTMLRFAHISAGGQLTVLNAF